MSITNTIHKIIECVKCKEPCNENVKEPILFECEHGICRPCYKELNSSGKNDAFNCPTCNTQIKKRNEKEVKKSPLLASLVSIASKEKRCTKHGSGSLVAVCMDCREGRGK